MSRKKPAGIVFFDTETRSQLSLEDVSAIEYAAHPSTELLLFTAVMPDGEELIWGPDKVCSANRTPSPHAIRRWNEHLERGGLVCAHNALFDTEIIAQVGGQHGFHEPSVTQTLCTKALCGMNQLPGGLGAASMHLGLGDKHAAGGRAMRGLADGNRRWDEVATEEVLDAFWAYGMQDARLCHDLFYALHSCGAKGWRTYQVVLAENVRGVPVDTELAHVCAGLRDELKVRTEAGLRQLTGLQRVTDPALRKWFVENVIAHHPTLAELAKTDADRWTLDQHARKRLLKHPDLPDLGRRVLEAMELKGSSPLTKFDRIAAAFQGRIYDSFAPMPTVTGRHASYGIQLDNLPKIVGRHDDPEKDVRDLKAGLVEEVAARSGVPVPQLLLDMLRYSICAPEGRVLTWGDWSSIEARVLPWLCNTDESRKVLDVFAAGGDLYAVTAGRMYGVDADEIIRRRKDGDAEADSLRQRGKIAILALGFGGGPDALLHMARSYGMELSWDEADDVVRRYRAGNPWLEPFWRRLERAVNLAIENPQEEWPVGRVAYRHNRGILYCRLPCGRELVHHDVWWDDHPRDKWKTGWAFRVRAGRGAQTGRRTLRRTNIVENITQAAAASLLHDLMDRLDAAGHGPVLSRHDEVLIEGPRAYEEELHEMMVERPSWAADLPLAAEVHSGRRYSK